ncbi:MAG: hydrogenase maturation protease [Chloroflexi bacterium]|nr:hydrogenase maturation protease [Chloroflexota bacterium]MCL5273353.1 hydrogenase maturation protease [Chloroflexota bacterium]
MSKSLIVGYGNPDRQDDGVAWHILKALGRQFGRIGPDESPDDITDLDLGELQGRDGVPDLLGELQLTPEIAETLAAYDKVCFVDAHTGAYPQDVNIAPLEARYQSSPFTHHLTPDTCLELARAAYGRAPEALVVSVRGYQFGFSHELSPQTAALAEEAAGRIAAWIKE